MSELYEVVIYTASVAKYAIPLIRQLDPSGLVSHSLFRNHCSVLSNIIVKDLSLLGRDLSKVIIIDNSPSAYTLQPHNAIPIETWTGNQFDKSLMELVPMLETLSAVGDVRKEIQRVYGRSEVSGLAKGKLVRYSLDGIQIGKEQSSAVQQIKPRFIPLSLRINKGNIKFPQTIYENARILPSANKSAGRLIPFVNNKPVTCERLKLAATIDQQHSLEYRFATDSALLKNAKKSPPVRFSNLTLYNGGKLSREISCKSHHYAAALYNKNEFAKVSEGIRVSTASKTTIEIRKNTGALITPSNICSPIYLTGNKNKEERKYRYELALEYDKF
eukprot:TRINITY_DN7317_c0_g5_i10.p1 TRINITY_DN7317_c0_g5~~TRINITY_DN7317_c0_g5_i10.p1  ORF type:complete len:331 (+),score=69.08 TRINITY_DN7317_c0_g5_i10:602-1594(+)